jgi:anti-anti-sigma factor
MCLTHDQSAPILNIRFERLGDSLSMVLSGELDEYSSMALHAAVEFVSPYEHVYADCAALEFIDSHGLAALMHARDWLERQHGSLRLINLSPPVKQVLRLCRVTPRLTMRGDAVALSGAAEPRVSAAC